MLLHNPTDFPNVKDQYFRVPLDRDVTVGITPMLMNTSEALRSYSPERRQCFFTTERNLRHFSIYTQANCDFECYTNYTLKKCDCVAYYMPREFKFCAHCSKQSETCVILDMPVAYFNCMFGGTDSVTLCNTWIFLVTLHGWYNNSCMLL